MPPTRNAAVSQKAPVQPDIMNSLGEEEIVVVLNGKRAYTNPTVSGNKVTLAIADVRFTIVARDRAGSNLTIDSQGRVLLNDSRTFAIDVSGLHKTKTHSVWMYSEPQLLESFTVSPSAESVSKEIDIPKDANAGWHSVVLSGTSAAGDEFAASLRVNVPAEENLVLKIATSGWVWALLIGAVASALVLPSRSRSRRRNIG